MKKLIIIIEKTSDYYSAYAENCEGVYAGGDSIDEVKKDIDRSIKLLNQEWNKENIPEILKDDYKIEYKLDLASFLKYYSNKLSLAGLQSITGVNQGQLSHYINGTSKPRPSTVKKIEDGLRKFGNEISQVELVY